MKMSMLALVLCISSMSSGCNSSVTSTASKQASLRDREITLQIEKALSSEPTLQNLSLQVLTTKGDVLLRGYIHNEHQLNTVHELVLSVSGVHTIHDHTSMIN